MLEYSDLLVCYLCLLVGIIRLSVREDVIPFTVITTISATDADSSTNGAVSYSQVSSTGPTGLFTVSPTGIVTVTSSLDREDTPQYSIQVSYHACTIDYQSYALSPSDESDRWRLSLSLRYCCSAHLCE